MGAFASLLGLAKLLGIYKPTLPPQEQKRVDHGGVPKIDGAGDALMAPFRAIYEEVERRKYPRKLAGDALAEELLFRQDILSRLPGRQAAGIRMSDKKYYGPKSLLDADLYPPGLAALWANYTYAPDFMSQNVYIDKEGLFPRIERDTVGTSGLGTILDERVVALRSRMNTMSWAAIHATDARIAWNGIHKTFDTKLNPWFQAGRDAMSFTYDTLGQSGRNPGVIGGELLWSCMAMGFNVSKFRIHARFVGVNRHPRFEQVDEASQPPCIRNGWIVYLVGPAESAGFFDHGYIDETFKIDRLSDMTAVQQQGLVIFEDLEDDFRGRYHVLTTGKAPRGGNLYYSFEVRFQPLDRDIAYTPISPVLPGFDPSGLQRLFPATIDSVSGGL